MTPREVGTLISCQVGSVRTSKHLVAAGLKDTPTCELCGREDEDGVHMLWKCAATQAERKKHWPELPPGWEDWPQCAKNHGIFPHLRDKDKLRGCYYDLGTITDRGIGYSEQQDDGEQNTPELFGEDGRLKMFTDDSRKGPASYPWLQRGGSGVWFGPRHRNSLRAASRGPDPSNQRSELNAAIYTLEVETRPCEIRSDSAWTLFGAWAIQGGAGLDDTWQHVELWHRLRVLIRGRDVGFRKVRAHVKTWETRYDPILAEDTGGNDAADLEAKAGAGADLPQLPWDEVEKVRKSRAIQAARTHRMITAVLIARTDQLDEKRKGCGWPLGRKGADSPPEACRTKGDVWKWRPDSSQEHNWARVAECITLATGYGKIASHTSLKEDRIMSILGWATTAQWATTNPPLMFGTTWAEIAVDYALTTRDEGGATLTLWECADQLRRDIDKLEKYLGKRLIPQARHGKVRSLVPFGTPALSGLHARLRWTDHKKPVDWITKSLENAAQENELRSHHERQSGWGWKRRTDLPGPKEDGENARPIQFDLGKRRRIRGKSAPIQITAGVLPQDIAGEPPRVPKRHRLSGQGGRKKWQKTCKQDAEGLPRGRKHRVSTAKTPEPKIRRKQSADERRQSRKRGRQAVQAAKKEATYTRRVKRGKLDHEEHEKGDANTPLGTNEPGVYLVPPCDKAEGRKPTRGYYFVHTKDTRKRGYFSVAAYATSESHAEQKFLKRF